ncbi:MAG TPA: DUF1588 domain-containing protein, partial [Polyangiaceae bacterium]|nr:DUF1588 domain-containing protein [Polyangiaceae bacterium]
LLCVSLACACTGVVGEEDKSNPPASGTVAGTGGGAGTAGGPGVDPGLLSTGGVRLRLLTRAEYRGSIQALFGQITSELALPDDTSVAGFVAVGASQVTVGELAVEAYESASRAVTAEVFGDAQRWQALVGCQPQPDLSDGCVTTFVQSFGKRAFRRDLTDAEVQTWVTVAQSAALLAGSADQGLATVTSGLLQSPNFLYRVETNAIDASNGRLKYDGSSMATRLAYLLTGGPPNAELLAAAAAGQLDTADGVRTAAAPLLAGTSAVDSMAAFLSEFAQAQQVLKVSKSEQLFPGFNAALQSSMLEATRLFLKNVVLAPNADVRSFYDSDQTFVDAALAPIYGVAAPASGFAQVALGPETGRAGILGQASVLAGESQPDRSSPTRRGVFILQNLLCQTPSPPPPGVLTVLPQDPNTTTRQKLEEHRKNLACAGCHALFDPLGLALEHFDAIGQYRVDEDGLAIDATGNWNGVAFDGAAQLGAALRQDPGALSCMMRSFYRDANGRVDDEADAAQIETLVELLASHGYVWANLVADFVASDAFRSAPALPLTETSP